jgi:hypothetical protein
MNPNVAGPIGSVAFASFAAATQLSTEWKWPMWTGMGAVTALVLKTTSTRRIEAQRNTPSTEANTHSDALTPYVSDVPYLPQTRNEQHYDLCPQRLAKLLTDLKWLGRQRPSSFGSERC